ncbi:hypothetical protein DYH10_01725 [Candidatus Saccharibacteria bacterium CPR2]|nr:hypothetical protein [Candidatus Saccharibacteria bacterium CPR2]
MYKQFLSLLTFFVVYGYNNRMSNAAQKSKLQTFRLFFEELPKEAPHERLSEEFLEAQEKSPILPVKRIHRHRKNK